MGNEFSKSPEPQCSSAVLWDKLLGLPAPPAPVLTDQPWRKTKLGWSEEDHGKLKEITEKLARGNEQKINILLLGPISSGKTSFINSVESLRINEIANLGYSGTSDTSITKKYAKYDLENFFLHDSMGVELGNAKGFHVDDVVHVINGNISPNYMFNPASPITKDDTRFIHDPPSESKVHCVVFFVDATKVSNDLPNDLMKKIGTLQDRIQDMDVPRLLCLTKIDLLSEDVDKDLTTTFRNVKVRDAVKRASEIFKLPQSNIHPIKNYENDVDTQNDVDILLMYPLKQALRFATDFSSRLQK